MVVGEYILSGVALALVALVFWSVKVMIGKQDSKIIEIDDKVTFLDTKIEGRFIKNEIDREILKDLYLDEKTHSFICGKMQADFKLHVSEIANENRKLMLEAINKNREFVEELIKELRVDIKKNNYIK